MNNRIQNSMQLLNMTRITHFSRKDQNNYKKKLLFKIHFLLVFIFYFPRQPKFFKISLEFLKYTYVHVENVIPRVQNRFGIFHFRPLFPQSNLQFCWQTS